MVVWGGTGTESGWCGIRSGSPGSTGSGLGFLPVHPFLHTLLSPYRLYGVNVYLLRLSIYQTKIRNSFSDSV